MVTCECGKKFPRTYNGLVKFNSHIISEEGITCRGKVYRVFAGDVNAIAVKSLKKHFGFNKTIPERKR